MLFLKRRIIQTNQNMAAATAWVSLSSIFGRELHVQVECIHWHVQWSGQIPLHTSRTRVASGCIFEGRSVRAHVCLGMVGLKTKRGKRVANINMAYLESLNCIPRRNSRGVNVSSLLVRNNTFCDFLGHKRCHGQELTKVQWSDTSPSPYVTRKLYACMMESLPETQRRFNLNIQPMTVYRLSRISSALYQMPLAHGSVCQSFVTQWPFRICWIQSLLRILRRNDPIWSQGPYRANRYRRRSKFLQGNWEIIPKRNHARIWTYPLSLVKRKHETSNDSPWAVAIASYDKSPFGQSQLDNNGHALLYWYCSCR